MNGAELHLLTNHFPVTGSFIVFALLLIGIIIKNETVIKIALGFFIFISIVALPTYFSGEEAEEVVEHLPGVSHDAIHEHEEASEIAIILMEITGLLALGAFFISRYFGVLTKGVLILSAITIIFMVRVAWLGGKIMHKELDKSVIIDH